MGVAIPGGQHNLGYSGAHNIRGSVILNKNNPILSNITFYFLALKNFILTVY